MQSENEKRFHFKVCVTPEDCWCDFKLFSWGLLLTVFIFVGEVVGGLWSGSLALLGDAGHVFGDGMAFIVVLISLLIVKLAEGDEQKVYNIGGFINALFLCGVAVWLFTEALERWDNPHPVEGWTVIIVAAIGAVGNFYQHKLVSLTSNTALRAGMKWHTLSDLAQSIAVVFGGIAVLIFDNYKIDPGLSFLIAIWIFISSIKLMGEVLTGKYNPTKGCGHSHSHDSEEHDHHH